MIWGRGRGRDGPATGCDAGGGRGRVVGGRVGEGSRMRGGGREEGAACVGS